MRRGKKKSNTKNENEMVFLGCNAAGLLNKMESLRRNVQTFKPGVIFIQESKTKRKNKIKLDNSVIFERIVLVVVF